jgi:N-acetyltransferase 10
MCVPRCTLLDELWLIAVQMGYGARALQALNTYYSGEYFNLDEAAREEPAYPDAAAVDEEATLLTDKPTVRAATDMPPLLLRLTERKAEDLDYLGVSYGMTPQLLRYAASEFTCTPS